VLLKASAIRSAFCWRINKVSWDRRLCRTGGPIEVLACPDFDEIGAVNINFLGGFFLIFCMRRISFCVDSI
jgi:hypothetical protein